jgi:hypothetical protein
VHIRVSMDDGCSRYAPNMTLGRVYRKRREECDTPQTQKDETLADTSVPRHAIESPHLQLLLCVVYGWTRARGTGIGGVFMWETTTKERVALYHDVSISFEILRLRLFEYYGLVDQPPQLICNDYARQPPAEYPACGCGCSETFSKVQRSSFTARSPSLIMAFQCSSKI